jgi:ankyrin repeat protein
MDQIFNLIKSRNFNKIKEIIKNDKDINLDIYDDQNNYLIHYILLHDQIDILKIIIKRNIRLDVLDVDGRTILYVPIKFNLINSLKILLDNNNNLIGISVLDIKDNMGFTALHYCIVLNNFDCLKELLNANADPLIRDKLGNNVLHLALQYNRSEIIYYLIDRISLNFLSNNNETILQLALSYQNIELINILLNKKINLNNQENEYGLGVIHQSIINNIPSITDKIIKNGADINLQDYYGNTGLMYAINENLLKQVKIFLNYSQLNYNLINFNGETATHLIFNNYNNFKDYPDIIEKFIQNTDLNIQDNNGITCLHLIIQNNLLYQYKDILENKELNIFIKNNNNISSFDFIKNNPNEIQIIVNSFYNYLQKNKDKLIIDWEIWCSTKENMELNKLDDSKCKSNIKDIIIKENRSIPKLKDYNLILDNGIFVNTCFYTGSPIDILFGVLFLYDSFKDKGLNLIIDYPLTSNKELENYYRSLGINYNYKLDFCNFEINWIYQKLIIPTYFDYEIRNKIKTSEYIIIPLGIETSIGAHANILFYNVKKSIVERFEPNGANPPKGFNYNPKLLDQLLDSKFKKIDEKIKFLRPVDYLPVISFQILENINDMKCQRIGDPNGFCGVWCIWWIYHKMKNLNISSKELVEKIITEIKFKNLNFKTVIRNFSKNISDLRDNFLKKYKIDINDFIVENYDSNILNNLEKDIIKYL